VSPIVSVLLPAQDEERRIGGAIESILTQKFDDWELVVVDDRSHDRTAEVVRSYGDPRIVLVEGEGRGLAAALNVGLRAARAELVARQDADDRALPARFERQVEFMHAHPDVTVLGTGWIELDADERPVRSRARFVAGPLDDLLAFNPLTHTTVVFRREAIMELGGYDESLRFASDYDLWLRVAAAGGRLWNLDEPLAVRVMTGENIAARHARGQIASELRVRLRDVRRRRKSGLPATRALAVLAARLPSFAVPLALKRLVRRAREQAP
jgi:glycosyltransferase involved in cell wall biosynthesis